jgi:hypothetical protein
MRRKTIGDYDWFRQIFFVAGKIVTQSALSSGGISVKLSATTI